MHFQKSLEIKGDRVGIFEIRRHFASYFKGLPDFKETRLKLVTATNAEDIFGILEYIANRWGNFDEIKGMLHKSPLSGKE